mmetsp:Transcript_29256/g.62996  ORF Transcript_29256/g.62996 Transcript_29256/m.62996 type:complete len:98 (+) Transcript_29256:390-683(+)
MLTITSTVMIATAWSSVMVPMTAENVDIVLKKTIILMLTYTSLNSSAMVTGLLKHHLNQCTMPMVAETLLRALAKIAVIVTANNILCLIMIQFLICT